MSDLEILVKRAKDKAAELETKNTIETKVIELEDGEDKFEESMTFEKLGVC